VSDAVPEAIGAAFADAPRPRDGELLHERCFDDNDIAALYGFSHWRELPAVTAEARRALAWWRA
jgi:hypothetical protein